jgi:hypothetical protein
MLVIMSLLQVLDLVEVALFHVLLLIVMTIRAAGLLDANEPVSSTRIPVTPESQQALKSLVLG